MPALTMSEELRRLDQRDARRETRTHRCDQCPDPGFDFCLGFWLCRHCLRRLLLEFWREVYA